MAFESHYFKREIKKEITSIRKLLDISLSPLTAARLDEVFSKVEIKLFMISFSTRKLIETRKLPDSVLNTSIKITRYPRNKRQRGPFFDFEKLYDLNNPSTEEMSLKDILNQFMHSFVFQASGNTRGRLGYVYFCSDFAQDRYLYFANIKSYINLILKVIQQEVKHISITYDEVKKRHVTTVG
jgi:hypothetical protein